MGLTVLPYRYKVNGLIDTSQTVMDNIELIGNSCATWLTYDAMNGRWSVVINQAGDPVSSFTDSSVIGSINLSGTGLADLYNSVEVRFPHRDLNDQEDYIKIEIPDVDRLANEPDNCLTINLPVINDPVQAQIIGLIELKQARLDKIIDFKTDYSKINLQAGDIIDVTNTVYGWTNKEFRIIRMEEVDQDGAIVIGITALEYSDDVYDLSDLYRYSRSNADGILTQGALGTPSTPSVTKYEEDANPRVDISSTTPNNTDPLNQAGIIEAMEFWISTDGTNYNLLATKKPDTALTFAANTTVTFTYNNVNTNFYIKTRCVNSTTTGAFSSPASAIFAPKQVTDIIKDGTTTLKDSGGGSLATALGIATLVNKLGNAFGSNSSAKLSEAVFSQAGFPNTKNIMVSDAAGLVTVSGLAPMTSALDPSAQMGANIVFTASQTATYKVDCIIDQNSSGAAGGRGPIWSEDDDTVSVDFTLTDNVTSTVVANSVSGGVGAQSWTDFAITDTVSLVAGRSYTLRFFYFVYTESNPTAAASFDISYNIYTISP